MENLAFKSVKIIVDENLPRRKSANEIQVNLAEGLQLRVGDYIIFNEKHEELPEWVLSVVGSDIFDRGITLTRRNILNNHIQFFARLD